jgi:PIN domain nuclease of toxin-antitoxin system
MAKVVLDTSALLAFVNGEPGGAAVADLIGDAVVSTVNLAEAVTKLMDRGSSLVAARGALAMADYEVAEFDRGQAETTGALVVKTRHKGLSLGDRACLALALRENAPAVTADRAWSDLDLAVAIHIFR